MSLGEESEKMNLTTTLPKQQTKPWTKFENTSIYDKAKTAKASTSVKTIIHENIIESHGLDKGVQTRQEIKKHTCTVDV
ncbi:hypothetical protein Ciccas_012631 [Cichlidogyrus casuarinus]|uniref:Uncharacterized protein n=1 Tax=Cichlidogyrus casuarinus TaxID=1844966 RepID=A0ABD2PQV5_9PLAT